MSFCCEEIKFCREEIKFCREEIKFCCEEIKFCREEILSFAVMKCVRLDMFTLSTSTWPSKETFLDIQWYRTLANWGEILLLNLSSLQGFPGVFQGGIESKREH